MIQVSNVRKEFDGFVAVDGISFEVRPGEVFGLLGPNGAGKTTTLRMITTVLRPTGGEITIGGRDALREPEEVRRQLGVLTENTGLYARLTAEENVRYFARLRDMSDVEITERIAEIFPLLGIDEFTDQRAGTLSKGMGQKVALAAAILHDPPVLLFDEPTSGLDVMSARQVRAFIERYRGTEKTVLLSTHLMPEAEALCDRIGIIHQGHLIALGSVEDLRRLSGKEELEDVFVELVEGSGEL